MNFDKSIKIDRYTKEANQRFDETQRRLSAIEDSFYTRADGKTVGGMVGSMIGTVVWLAVLIAGAYFVRDMVDRRLLWITAVTAGLLLLSMFIDHVMDFFYYGKIVSNQKIIAAMQSMVQNGKSLIGSNRDAFMAAGASGWNYRLNVMPSIPGAATAMEIAMSRMKTVQKESVNISKNFLFYATVVAITVVGGITFFPFGRLIVAWARSTIGGAESFSADTVTIFSAGVLVVAGILEILLAKYVWSRTDCNVTNATLFIALLGPILFLAMLALASVIVSFVIAKAEILFVVIVLIALVAAGVTTTSTA